MERWHVDAVDFINMEIELWGDEHIVHIQVSIYKYSSDEKH